VSFASTSPLLAAPRPQKILEVTLQGFNLFSASLQVCVEQITLAGFSIAPKLLSLCLTISAEQMSPCPMRNECAQKSGFN